MSEGQITTDSFDATLASWIARLQAQADARTAASHAEVRKRFPGLLEQPSHTNFAVVRIVAETGPKYVRIVSRDVRADGSLYGGSAIAFVERSTGNVYKPASFKGPTKNFVRGNIFTAGQEPRMNY